MTNETVSQTYRIPEANLCTLKAQIEKLQHRAQKMNVGEIAFEQVSYEDVPEIVANQPTGKVRRWYSVRITGTTPKFAGWSFLGTVEHAGEAGNIMRSVPGTGDLPHEYRDAEPTCDHCQLSRRRNETFILRHDDGTLKRVGRNCLRDFLGHADPQQLAAFAEMLMQAHEYGMTGEEDDEAFWSGSHVPERFDLVSVLRTTAAVIRIDGWMSRKKAEEFMGTPTSHIVSNILTNPRFPKREKYASTEADRADADATMAWAEGLVNQPGLNDYMYNLSVLGKQTSINYKGFGLACSMVAKYLSEKERELYRAKARQVSEWVGEVKKRQEFTLTLLKDLVLDSDSKHGPWWETRIRPSPLSSGDQTSKRWQSSSCLPMHRGRWQLHRRWRR